MRRRAIALLLVTAFACTRLTEPPLPSGATAMAALPQYDLWWRLTERCADQTGDLSQISWYVVPDAQDLGTPDLAGLYFPLSRRIVLAGRYAASGPLVRHEMLHAIIRHTGHPAEYFQRRCGGVVVCDADCVHDGGALPAVDSTGPVVRPEDLEVAARVDSTNPSLARDSGWVALTIAIRNPRPGAVRVHLTPLEPAYFASVTYGYHTAYCDVAGYSGSEYTFMPDSTIVLGAGETRRDVFDFRVWGCTLVEPYFNDDTLDIIRIEPQQ